MSLYDILSFFLIYSFFGWCAEVAYAALSHGIIVNRGFLNGPVCPIYGVGMLGILLFAGPVSHSLPLLFLAGVLFCSFIELVGGWILEKFFHTRWWDYSDDPLNLGGYICLGFSILWGLAVVFVVRLIHPAVAVTVHLIPKLLGTILLGLFGVLFMTDFVLTLIALIGLRRRLGELERVADALHSVGDTLSDRVGNSALAADQKLSPLVESGKERLEDAVENSREKLEVGMERLDAAKEAGRERLDAGKEKLESGKERLEAAKDAQLSRFADAVETRRERLDARLDSARGELTRYRMQLETRMEELRKFGPIARFHVRRLEKAYPALRRELKARMETISRRR